MMAHRTSRPNATAVLLDDEFDTYRGGWQGSEGSHGPGPYRGSPAERQGGTS